MAEVRITSRRSTGGKAPPRKLATKALRKKPKDNVEAVGLSKFIVLNSDDILAQLKESSVTDQTALRSRENPSFRAGKRFELPILVGGLALVTLPDLGSDINAITIDTLKRLKLKGHTIWDPQEDKIQLANMSFTEAQCRVTLVVKVPGVVPPDDDGTYGDGRWEFHVLPKLATGVQAVVGRKFLERYQILDSNTHLLQEILESDYHIPRYMSIRTVGKQTLLLKVYLNFSLIFAFPDTGSELDLISRECAERLNLDIIPFSSQDEDQVEYADGSYGKLTGYVHVRFDTLEDFTSTERQPTTVHPRGSEHVIKALRESSRPTRGPNEDSMDNKMVFYVLDELPQDVTLSQQLLHSIGAFEHHKSAFVLMDDTPLRSIQTIFRRKGETGKTMPGTDQPLASQLAMSPKKRKVEIELTPLELIEVEPIRQEDMKNKLKSLEEQLSSTQTLAEFENIRQQIDELRREDQAAIQAYDTAVQTLRANQSGALDQCQPMNKRRSPRFSAQ